MIRASSPVSITVTICVAEILSMIGFSAYFATQPVLIERWQLSNTDAGWINGIFFAGYLVAVPVLTALTDKVPPRRIYMICMVLSTLAALGFAVLTEGFWPALVFRALAGIGLAGTYMPGLKLLTDYLHGTEHSRSLAFYTSSFGVGASISFVLAGYLADAYGWQWAFILGTIGPLLALVLFAALLPKKDPAPEKTPDTHLLDFRPVLRCRPAMAYVLAYMAHNFELFAFRGWIVTFLVFVQMRHPGEAFQVSAATLAALINLIGVPSSIMGNEFARDRGRHRIITAVMLASAVMACLVGVMSTLPYWMLITFCLLYAVTVNGDSASLTAGAVSAAPEGYRGATMAVHSSLGFAGAFIGPLVFGVVLDATGGGASVTSWALAFALGGLIVALGPVALHVLGRTPR